MAVLLSLVFAACAHAHVHVPPTPEGEACIRHCIAITCEPEPRHDDGHCDAQYQNCLRTCPGATEE